MDVNAAVERRYPRSSHAHHASFHARLRHRRRPRPGRRARVGAFAGAGSQLLSIVPASGLWVDANFKEGQLAHMRPGMPVEVEIPEAE